MTIQTPPGKVGEKTEGHKKKKPVPRVILLPKPRILLPSSLLISRTRKLRQTSDTAAVPLVGLHSIVVLGDEPLLPVLLSLVPVLVLFGVEDFQNRALRDTCTRARNNNECASVLLYG